MKRTNDVQEAFDLLKQGFEVELTLPKGNDLPRRTMRLFFKRSETIKIETGQQLAYVTVTMTPQNKG